jgi:hypothetical protein
VVGIDVVHAATRLAAATASRIRSIFFGRFLVRSALPAGTLRAARRQSRPGRR